uniref:FBA_2 domain-containing protein n=1 Tax=Caenorhabditis tropicalis TaxID=1561998 RepID=A0A1I7TMM7_9PELO
MSPVKLFNLPQIPLSMILNSMTFEEIYPLDTDCLHFSNESWMTIQNLMEVDCGFLFMPKESRLVNEDMNLFLNHWMNGGNPKLRRIFLRLKHFDLDTILNGIEGKWRKNHNWITYNSFDETECKLPSSSFEIRRNDGTIASIVSSGLFERRGFYLFVWPDYKGLPYPLDSNYNE